MAAKTTKTEEIHSILDYFAAMPDHCRNIQNNRHQLTDIIIISILATICGAEHFTEMEDYGRANQEFLQTQGKRIINSGTVGVYVENL